MNEPTVSEVAKMQWNSAVDAVSGIVEMLHPPMIKPGWSLQNGRLQDPTTGAVIEFMFSKLPGYPNPGEARGRVVHLKSRLPGDLQWKEQKPKPNVNGGRPFAKLEVGASALVTWDTEGAATAPKGSQSGHTEGLLAELATAEIFQQTARVAKPKGSANVDVESAPRGTEAVKKELRQMLAMYALTEGEINESPFARTAPKDELRWRVFAAGCSAGLHRSLDPAEVLLEIDPTEAEKQRPRLAELKRRFANREALLDTMLRGSGKIRMEQTFLDLTEEQASQILESPEATLWTQIGDQPQRQSA
jgi:hypothetical protein